MKRYLPIILVFLVLICTACTTPEDRKASDPPLQGDEKQENSSADEVSVDFYSFSDFYDYVHDPSHQWHKYQVDEAACLPLDRLFPNEEIGYIVIIGNNHYSVSFKGLDGTTLTGMGVRVKYDPQYETMSSSQRYPQASAFVTEIDLNTVSASSESVSHISSGRVLCVKDGCETVLSVYQGEIASFEFSIGAFLLEFDDVAAINSPSQVMEFIDAFTRK